MGTKLLGYRYPKWTAIYACVKHEAQAVIVNSTEEPEPKRTFRIPGKGRVAFRAVSITQLHQPKEGKMAKRKTKKKAEPVDEVDDDLEDLEDLEELDDLDEDEPDEVDEDEDSEDEEDEDLDDDEEDEDEEEDLTSLSLKVLRQRAQAAGMPAAKAKGQKGDKGKKALAKYIEANEGVEDEDEDDEPEEKPKAKSKKSKAKGKKKGKGGNAPPTRELPKGRLGAQDVADAAGVDARKVRVFLRKHADEFPKDEELGRYSFTKTDVKKIVKAMKAADKE